MMMKTFGRLIAAVALAAAGSVQGQSDAPVRDLTEYDDGTTLRVDVGDEIRVHLPQQPDPSYNWAMRRDPHLSMIAAPTSVRVRGNTGIVGMPMYREFRIRVLGTGRFPLVFGLRSAALGPDQSPARRITYSIDAAGGRATPDRPAPRPGATVAIDDEGVRLVSGGTTRAVPFGTPMTATLAALRGLGQPDMGESPECDTGPTTTAGFTNGLTLYFQEKRFVGWGLERAAAGRVTTLAGAGIGSTRAQLQRAYSVKVSRTTLGTEFTIGDMSGILSGPQPTARVTSMWAGNTCLAR